VLSIAQVGSRCSKSREIADLGGVCPTDAEWLTAAEAARYFKVKTRTFLLWTRQNKVRGYVLSGIKRRVWRFRKADLDAMLLGQDAGVLSSASPSVLTIKAMICAKRERRWRDSLCNQQTDFKSDCMARK
jgi:excisionase family DNA binding protein